ncbi:MAG: hypothetical protein KatS3mg105_2623 [Gemmatales bacterium]|nr:MAG: hypothetical protein KatS3mg105_2623 [Gemmatales bacterium]
MSTRGAHERAPGEITGHDFEDAHDNSDKGLMNESRNTNDDKHELDLLHLYRLRDAEDQL